MKSKAIELAEWSDWFCRNVPDPQDFRWRHMAEQAAELRRMDALNQELLDGLKTIEGWCAHTPAYAADFGSNGVRDFYRAIARQTITKAKETTEVTATLRVVCEQDKGHI